MQSADVVLHSPERDISRTRERINPTSLNIMRVKYAIGEPARVLNDRRVPVPNQMVFYTRAFPFMIFSPILCMCVCVFLIYTERN